MAAGETDCDWSLALRIKVDLLSEEPIGSRRARSTSVELSLRHADHERLSCVFVDDVQSSIEPPVSGLILDEVIGPDVVGPFGP